MTLVNCLIRIFTLRIIDEKGIASVKNIICSPCTVPDGSARSQHTALSNICQWNYSALGLALRVFGWLYTVHTCVIVGCGLEMTEPSDIR